MNTYYNIGNNIDADPTGVRVLGAARRCWDSAADFRERRHRFKRFTYGDQWSDLTKATDGRIVTEGELAAETGKKPLSNNLIRRLVKCVVGRFRDMAAEQSVISGADTAACADAADLEELDSRLLEEFLISGCAVQRVSTVRCAGRSAAVDNVSPERFFINAISDPRGNDTRIVGMLHDYSPAELAMLFANGDYRRSDALRTLYRGMEPHNDSFGRLGSDGYPVSFLQAPDGRCRVIEAWTLEAVETFRLHDPLTATLREIGRSEVAAAEQENQRRAEKGIPPVKIAWDMSTRWVGRWLAPDGTTLRRVTAPAGRSHPFAVKLYPLTDGEVHSLVEDVIDQQIYVNRLITLIDHVINVSAKGVLLFPAQQKMKNMDWAEIGRIWATPGSVLPLNSGLAHLMPQQVSGNAGDCGARELLALQLKMFEDVSGVTNALMGKPSNSGSVGAERFEAEVRNATVAIGDMMRTFLHFRTMRDRLLDEWL